MLLMAKEFLRNHCFLASIGQEVKGNVRTPFKYLLPSFHFSSLHFLYINKDRKVKR